MPQASDELRARWGIAPERAMNALSPSRFENDNGLIRPKQGVIPTEEEYSAIDFLCDEWDYAWDPRAL